MNDPDSSLDSLVIGRRIRQFRKARGLTVGALGAAIGRAASQVSIIENGRRELRISDLQRIAAALDVTLDQLLEPKALSRRDRAEVELERIQDGALHQSLGLPRLPVRKTLSDDALDTILRLYRELARMAEQRAATPEELRRANADVRAEQRARDNYYDELETVAADMLATIGHTDGPLTRQDTADLAAAMGFTLRYVDDLPPSTRSITDRANDLIYLPRQAPTADPRSALLKALATATLGRPEPQNYADLLRQRVETNYVVGALLVPERAAVDDLTAAKRAREIAVEDLRDRFAVSYETAAHRLTNLITHHLGIPVHFLKVHQSGAISKAYENDGVLFPTDALGTVEGQIVCRWWAARQVFDAEDRDAPFHQYTDKPNGTYWCASAVQASSQNGDFSVSVGTTFDDAKWFRGRDTAARLASRCPDPSCCRTPEAGQAEYWGEHAWPSARMHSSLLAAMPTGSPAGIDHVAVYEFLDRHSGRDA